MDEVQLGRRAGSTRRAGFSKSKYLKQAVDTYREALTVLSKDKSPELWGNIQDNLKIALDDLHQRGWKGS